MDYIAVTGGKRLEGEIPISGAKNSVLPLLASTILFREPCTLSGCPRLTDVEASIEILRCLGCQVFRENDRITVDSRTLSGCEISQPMMKKCVHPFCSWVRCWQEPADAVSISLEGASWAQDPLTCT